MAVNTPFTIKLEGWDDFEAAINPRKFMPIFMREVKRASRLLLRQAKKNVKDHIRNSKLWKPNAPWTLREKKGRKPLIDTRQMLKSVNGVIFEPSMSSLGGNGVVGGFIIGVNKSKQKSNHFTAHTKNRRKRINSEANYNIPYILHEGALLKNPQSGKTMVLPPRPFLRVAIDDPVFREKIRLSLGFALRVAFGKYEKKFSK